MRLGYGLLVLVIPVAGYLAYAYNALVANRKLAAEGWSGIEAQLRRRTGLVPNLVGIVSGYAAREDGLFRDIAERARSVHGGSVAEQSARGQAMSVTLGRLLAVAEAYPGLNADVNFRNLREQLARVEDELQLARRHYNGAVRNFNTMIESFPANFIANFFKFEKAEFFEMGDAATREVTRPGLKMNG